MNFELSDEQRELQSTIREFAQAEIAPQAAAWDRDQTFPIDVIRKLGALGVMGLPFPEAVRRSGRRHPGAGARDRGARPGRFVGRHHRGRERLARRRAAACCSARRSRSSAGWSPLAQGELLGAFASTEPGSGSDVAACQTRAVESGECRHQRHQGLHHQRRYRDERLRDHHRRHGRADGKREVSTILVPTRHAGLSRSARPTQDGLARLRHPRAGLHRLRRWCETCLLGPRGDGAKQFLTILDGGRIGVAALAVGLAQGCLDISTRLRPPAHRLWPADRPLSGDPVHAGRLATQIQAARLMTYHAAALKDAAKPYSEAAAMAKLFASELAVTRGRRGGPGARRPRLHGRDGRRPLLSRRQDPDDRRGHI